MGGSWGDFGGSEGGQGSSEEGRGGHPEVDNFFFHLVKFKIMGLCGGFSLLLKRPEMMLNEFFDDIFWESPFFRVFSGFRECFSDEFYDKQIVLQ